MMLGRVHAGDKRAGLRAPMRPTRSLPVHKVKSRNSVAALATKSCLDDPDI